TTVMQVPMRDIVERRMGIKVIDDVQLTKDLTVFGQVCFSDSTINVYDENTDAYVPLEVRRGTIFIDPNTNFLRCVGCGNNTLAHEAFHWWRHRIYATVRGILRKENHISYRCPTAPSRIHTTRATPSDTDWMEIQANAIAPKILMPRTQTETKVKQLVAFFGYNEGTSDYDTMRRIIDELADFYSVSKQAAKIRMIELGYPEAAEVYNYDVDCFYTSHEITEADAFHEAQTNEDFKALIDMELFHFAEGYFVINTDKYAIQGESGEYRLTDYARENLADCALNFRYDALDLVFALNRESGVMYKQSRTPRPVTIFTPEYNEELVSKALDEVPAALKSFDDAKALGNETVAQILARYMKQKKWNSSTFQTRTGLKSGHYSKTNTNPNRVYELPILVSICVGLDLPHGVSREILEKAGFKLNPAILEQSLYDYILSPAGSRNIPACNEFLQKAAEQRKEKVRPLGSGFYDGDRCKDDE
ncbi:MAG: ImmA/IrrE family metallo-endopeptidase, partial [Epsilonproteobacteria bacterium]|nr:ImmA/IrrE family metallo-endopeptidase [Campylobacterota bacterium]